MLKISEIVFVFVLALNQVRSEVPQKLFITLYYESKCPDSREYIVEQLQPTVNSLHQYLTLKLVPFGKANSINSGYNGFQCQHGPTECAGNMVQSCALDLMQGRSDVEKVSYVACEMVTEAGTKGNMECVEKAGLQSAGVKQCVFSEKGLTLQLDDEIDTKIVKPKFVPTVTLNGVFNQETQDSAMEDLKETLCSILKDVSPCAEHYNSKAMSFILF